MSKLMSALSWIVNGEQHSKKMRRRETFFESIFHLQNINDYKIIYLEMHLDKTKDQFWAKNYYLISRIEEISNRKEKICKAGLLAIGQKTVVSLADGLLYEESLFQKFNIKYTEENKEKYFVDLTWHLDGYRPSGEISPFEMVEMIKGNRNKL